MMGNFVRAALFVRLRVREYVFLIEKETNAYTLMSIKIHLINTKGARCLPKSIAAWIPFCLLCILVERCEFNQDENGIIKREKILPKW